MRNRNRIVRNDGSAVVVSDVRPELRSVPLPQFDVPMAAFVGTGADGQAVRAVGQLALWQMNNQQLDASLRVGLPVLAFLARSSYRTAALAAAAGAAVLWANRLLGLNL